jgi:hypothetical protein
MVEFSDNRKFVLSKNEVALASISSGLIVFCLLCFIIFYVRGGNLPTIAIIFSASIGVVVTLGMYWFDYIERTVS